MAIEKEPQDEMSLTYPKRIEMPDGTLRIVHSVEEEAEVRRQGREK